MKAIIFLTLILAISCKSFFKLQQGPNCPSSIKTIAKSAYDLAVSMEKRKTTTTPPFWIDYAVDFLRLIKPVFVNCSKSIAFDPAVLGTLLRSMYKKVPDPEIDIVYEQASHLYLLGRAGGNVEATLNTTLLIYSSFKVWVDRYSLQVQPLQQSAQCLNLLKAHGLKAFDLADKIQRRATIVNPPRWIDEAGNFLKQMKDLFIACGKPLGFDPSFIAGPLRTIEKKIPGNELDVVYEFSYFLYRKTLIKDVPASLNISNAVYQHFKVWVDQYKLGEEAVEPLGQSMDCKAQVKKQGNVAFNLADAIYEKDPAWIDLSLLFLQQMASSFKDCNKPLTFTPATIHPLLVKIKAKIPATQLDLLYQFCFALYQKTVYNLVEDSLNITMAIYQTFKVWIDQYPPMALSQTADCQAQIRKQGNLAFNLADAIYYRKDITQKPDWMDWTKAFLDQMAGSFKDCGRSLPYNPSTIHPLIKNIQFKIRDSDMQLLYDYNVALYQKTYYGLKDDSLNITMTIYQTFKVWIDQYKLTTTEDIQLESIPVLGSQSKAIEEFKDVNFSNVNQKICKLEMMYCNHLGRKTEKCNQILKQCLKRQN